MTHRNALLRSFSLLIEWPLIEMEEHRWISEVYTEAFCEFARPSWIGSVATLLSLLTVIPFQWVAIYFWASNRLLRWSNITTGMKYEKSLLTQIAIACSHDNRIDISKIEICGEKNSSGFWMKSEMSNIDFAREILFPRWQISNNSGGIHSGAWHWCECNVVGV